MAVGSGAGFVVDFSDTKQLLEDLNDARDALNALDDLRGVRGYSPAGTRMMRELRKQTQVMARQVIIPAVQERGRATGYTLDARMADTARAMNDRLPVVKVGAVNPKVSGFKRTAVGDRKYARGQLAWGSEKGSKGGAKRGRHAGLGVNYYGHQRVEPGRWIYWAINSAAVTRGVIQGYGAVVDALFAKWAWGPRTGDVWKQAS